MERASRHDLADAVDRAGWAPLLPPHRVDGEDQPVGRPTCVAAHRLSNRLMLTIVQDKRGHTYPVPLVLDGGGTRRARPGDGASEALIGLLSLGSRTLGDFEVTTWHNHPAAGERGITVDQTNDSVVVGEAAVVKWVFLADEGPHPAPSLLAILDEAGFTGMPRPWGTVQWRPPDGSPPRLVALVTEFVTGAEDGWTWAVEDIRAAALEGTFGRVEASGGATGELIASFHRALTSTIRLSTPDEVRTWRSGAEADLHLALDVTKGNAHRLLVEHEAAIRSAFAAMPAEATQVIRVHGDLHVGQVLHSQDSSSSAYILTDFDGNPVVPSADRVREQPAALDVAGMAQSFLHAGLVVIKHDPALDPARVVKTAQVARAAFLDAYRGGIEAHDDLLDERLLRPFALRQVCREFIYAATHLPRWSYVPERALPLLLDEENL